MESRSLKYVAEACGAECRGEAGLLVNRVCTDSRQAQPGDLFVALTGERFDGHAFLADVRQKGVAAVMVEGPRVAGELGMPGVVVKNARQALGQLAACYRRDFRVPVFAVAGSNGKTTTKELLASVLRTRLRTLWNEASFNNDIGVPQTLLRLESRHQALVQEVGTNHPGELAPLLDMVQPRYGLLTCIGREHLEFFGDLKGVAQEEGALAEKLPADGKLFANGDDEWVERLALRSRAAVVRVGLLETNDWQAGGLRMDEQGVTFSVRAIGPQWSGEYRVNLPGRHQVRNALLALAAGAELGLGREELQRGLAECQPPKMRMQSWSIRGARILDDAYNANADSMLAGLQTLADLPCAGRRIAVLGDMAELGGHTQAAHEEIGRRAAELRLGALYTVGRMAAVTAAAARRGGLSAVFEFADAAGAGRALAAELLPGDLVLLKASRAARLEQVGEFLKNNVI